MSTPLQRPHDRCLSWIRTGEKHENVRTVSNSVAEHLMQAGMFASSTRLSTISDALVDCIEKERDVFSVGIGDLIIECASGGDRKPERHDRAE